METLWESLDVDQRATLIPESKHAPIMLPSHLDMWCQTSPEPVPSPDPAIFLHGHDDSRPEIQICWRNDIVDGTGHPSKSFAEQQITAVSMTPPTSMECLSVPLFVFTRWLTAGSDGEQRTAGEELSDAATGATTPEDNGWSPHHTAVIWRGTDSYLASGKHSDWTKPVREIPPGSTIVLPAAAGGFDVFGHVPEPSPYLLDVGDECFFTSREKASLRLNADRVADWFRNDESKPNALPEPARHLVVMLRATDQPPSPTDILESLAAIFRRDELPERWSWLRRTLGKSPKVKHFFWSPAIWVRSAGSWQVSLRSRSRVRIDKEDEDAARRLELTRGESFTGDDEIDSARTRVTLMDHTDGVASFTHAFASGLLPEPMAKALETVARLHDIGKTDRRFQMLLFGGDALQASLNSAVPFAKSAGLNDVSINYRTALHRSGLPEGFRHELLSLQVAEEGKLIEDHKHRDLILHLIATHHGYSRPFAPVIIDSEPEHLDFEWNDRVPSIDSSTRQSWLPPHCLDSGVAERFWRLIRRYGWWGLAWLESVFVLADRRCSEAESHLEAENAESETAQQKELVCD